MPSRSRRVTYSTWCIAYWMLIGALRSNAVSGSRHVARSRAAGAAKACPAKRCTCLRARAGSRCGFRPPRRRSSCGGTTTSGFFRSMPPHTRRMACPAWVPMPPCLSDADGCACNPMVCPIHPALDVLFFFSFFLAFSSIPPPLLAPRYKQNKRKKKEKKEGSSPARCGRHALLSARAARVLTGACDPML